MVSIHSPFKEEKELVTKYFPDEQDRFQSTLLLKKRKNSGLIGRKIIYYKSFIGFYRHNNCEPTFAMLNKY
ncbi:hypothetical protein LEP1GSC049_3408 [Leptospira kirschneri serovar Cynopteri str. 3522 CT]|nr:hypothetical protein LEP1GSC049_3408 [Leptospira kirschneri serovar Cynopteri str. 3522 CT]